MSDTSFTPAQNPDLSTLDPATIGVDTNISIQFISERAQPFSVDPTNVLNIGKPINFTSDITVSGVINNTDLQNKLNDKANANDVYTRVVNDGKLQAIVNSLEGYQTIANMINYVTSTSLTSTLSSYLTAVTASSTYQTIANMTSYAPTNNPTFTGTVSIPSLTLNGLDVAANYQLKFVVAGFVNADGTIGGTYGRVGFTPSKLAGTGQYTITFSSNIGSTSYSVIGGLRNGAGYISYNGTATTAVNIQTYNTAGTSINSAFNFYILM